jgi:hypothetical protein
MKCSLRIEVDVVDVRLDGCAAKGDNEVAVRWEEQWTR